MLRVMNLGKAAGFAAVAFCSALCLPWVWADTRSNPYEPIASRNVFAIKPPPPPPPEQPVVPAAPLAKVVLTGVTTMFGANAVAMLEITEQEAGKAANVKKPILRVGEREGPVEVLSIDVANAQVRIKNSGVETNLMFEVAKAGNVRSTVSAPNPAPGMSGPR